MSRKAEIKSGEPPGIFISYRRKDSSGHAGRLKDALKRRFAVGVFMDIEKIAAGQDFVEAIDEAVGRCSVVLVLIGDQWLSLVDSSGRRRLDDPDDFVRREIAASLQRGITVIPILVKGAAMPEPDDLPEELKSLSRRNAHEISDKRWDYDVGALVEELKKYGLRVRPRGLTALSAVALAAVITAVLAGWYFLSGREMKGTQAGAAAAVGPSAADSKEREEVNHALELVGGCIAAADDMLEKLTNPDYDPRNFPKDRKRIDTVEKELGEATDKYNSANELWKREQAKLELLMSQHAAVSDSWRHARKAVTDYMDCVYNLNEVKSNGDEPPDASKACQREKKEAEEDVTLLTTSLGAARP